MDIRQTAETMDAQEILNKYLQASNFETVYGSMKEIYRKALLYKFDKIDLKDAPIGTDRDYIISLKPPVEGVEPISVHVKYSIEEIKTNTIKDSLYTLLKTLYSKDDNGIISLNEDIDDQLKKLDQFLEDAQANRVSTRIYINSPKTITYQECNSLEQRKETDGSEIT